MNLLGKLFVILVAMLPGLSLADPVVATSTENDRKSAYCLMVIGTFVNDTNRMLSFADTEERKRILLEYKAQKESDRRRVKEAVIDKLQVPGVWEATEQAREDLLANFDARLACLPDCQPVIDADEGPRALAICLEKCSASEVTKRIRSCDRVDWLGPP